MSNCFNPANILLPNDCIDMEKWSVIACDQFTSQADYWDAVEKHVADAPSTLNVVFPEIYLGTITKQENDCNSSGDGVKNDKETGRKTKSCVCLCICHEPVRFCAGRADGKSGC